MLVMLCVIASCTFEFVDLTNKTGEAIDITIQENGNRRYIELQNSEKKTEMIIYGTYNILYGVERGFWLCMKKKCYGQIYFVNGNNNVDVVINNNLKSCPNSAFVGKWLNSKGQFFEFYNSNKCYINHRIYNENGNNLFEWADDRGRLTFRIFDNYKVVSNKGKVVHRASVAQDSIICSYEFTTRNSIIIYYDHITKYREDLHGSDFDKSDEFIMQ